MDGKKSNLRISVLIPTLGRSRELIDTIESLLLQTHVPDEILIADQNQPPLPEVENVVARYSPLVRQIRSQIEGISHNYNLLLKEAQFPIVLFLDDDVVADRHLVEKHLKNYADRSITAVAGRVDQPEGDLLEESISSVGKYRVWDGKVTANFNSYRRRDVDFCQGCNMSYRRDKLLEIGGFSTAFGGNGYFFEPDGGLRLKKNGGRIVFDPLAQLKHLAAPRGGARVLDKALHTFHFMKNGTILFRRHSKKIFLPLFLLKQTLYCAAKAIKNKDLRIFRLGLLGLQQGMLHALPLSGELVTARDLEPRPLPIVLWVPEKKGGIFHYTKNLADEYLRQGFQVGFSTAETIPEILDVLKRYEPEILHIQHEYDLFGSKVPSRYWFPQALRSIREAFPKLKIIATAHTVLLSDFQYPLWKRGFQKPFRWMANSFLKQNLLKYWVESTWKKIDGVVVHSKTQEYFLKERGVKNIQVIPHFVKNFSPNRSQGSNGLKVCVFGYFTPEKGQDLAIEAWARLKDSKAQLILAGGVRRRKDQWYWDYCQDLVQKYDLQNRVFFVGTIDDLKLEEIFSQVHFMIAPFRETTGSGSLALAMGRGVPILTSNLSLNQEINQRTPGALAFFKTGNIQSLVLEAESLLKDVEKRAELSRQSLIYAQTFSLEKMAREHFQLYEGLRISNSSSRVDATWISAPSHR